MKVLLVNTSLMRPPVAPLGLDDLADSLRAAGHEPMLLDLCFSTDIEADLEAAGRRGPDVIGRLRACDREFNVPLEHSREVCRAMIEAGLGKKIRWHAYCSPAQFDAATATLMRNAGCAGPLETNPALRGERRGNGKFVRPVFFLSPDLGPDPAALVRGGARGACWDILRRMRTA